jgi:hypothetical protein
MGKLVDRAHSMWPRQRGLGSWWTGGGAGEMAHQTPPVIAVEDKEAVVVVVPR